MIERTQPTYGGTHLEPSFNGACCSQTSGGKIGRKLVGLDGPHNGLVFPLTGDAVVIGRDPDSGVTIADDPTVSRTHATILREENGHRMHDEGSSNGTFINGVLLQDCPLASGDIIQVGATILRYE